MDSLGFYTAEEAARIARVPRHEVERWRREGIVVPTLEDPGGARGYTFEALVYLRLLRMLRDKKITLAHSVRALDHLRERFGLPGPGWEAARIFVADGNVFVENKDVWAVTVATKAGQKAAESLFDREFENLRRRADALLVPSQFQAVVAIDPTIRNGVPIVRGTTLPTAAVYQLAGRKVSVPRAKQAYPWLSDEQARGALQFERFLDRVAA